MDEMLTINERSRSHSPLAMAPAPAPAILILLLILLLPSFASKEPANAHFTQAVASLNQSLSDTGEQLVIFGDSLMRKQLEYIQQHTTEQHASLQPILETVFKQPFNHDNRACSLLPKREDLTLVEGDHSTVIYHDFSALHLLQVYPGRPWEMSGIDENGLTGDFNGFLKLEDWMREEIACLSKWSGLIVVMTSHSVCESLFTDWWKEALDEGGT
jgi:hypothetical protein